MAISSPTTDVARLTEYARSHCRRCRARVAGLALLAAAGLLAPAAALAQASPSQTVQALLEAMAAHRWADAAALIDPRSAVQFQENELYHAAAAADYRRTGEPRPDTAAVWTLASVRLPAYDTATVELLPGYRTLGEHAALPPARFVALTWQAWGDNDYVARITAPTGGVLGEVMEGDSAAHVLVRFDGGRVYGDEPPGSYAVDAVSLRRVDGQWRVSPGMVLLPSLRMRLGPEESGVEPDPAR
jgi:hypothetical protein